MSLITPDWDVSSRVKAMVTTREVGNLALHVGDANAAARNRQSLVEVHGVPAEPMWLEQVHGNAVALRAGSIRPPVADAAYTRTERMPLAVMVADCLPVFLASPDGEEIGVAHAGWRGLANGVLASVLAKFEAERVVAWLGPAIGPCHYEVDEVVRCAFDVEIGFTPGRDASHWMMDLFEVARHQLRNLGVTEVLGGGTCTWCDERFYSHRRDAALGAGRIAAIIWKS